MILVQRLNQHFLVSNFRQLLYQVNVLIYFYIRVLVPFNELDELIIREREYGVIGIRARGCRRILVVEIESGAL